MATVKNGVNYEITADDKASKVVDGATKNVVKSTKEAGEAFRGEFNPMSTVMAGIGGSVEGVAQQMLGLVSRLKGVHMTMMKFSIYAALIMACVKAVKVLVEHWREARIAADKLSLDRVESSLANLKRLQEEWNKELERAREKTANIKDNILAEISATEKLSNARREYTKQLEISLAKTEEERAAIERRYSAEGAMEKVENDLSRIQAEREKLKKDIATWRESIANYKDDNKTLDKEWNTASKNFARTSKRVKNASWFWHFGLDDDLKLQTRAGDVMTNITDSRQHNLENINKLKDNIDNALKQLSRLKTNEETIKLTMKSEAVKADTAEKDAAKAAAEAKKKAEEEAQAKADAELKEQQKLADEYDKAMRKAAEDEAKAIKDARLKADKEVMAERKRRLTELTTMESDAAKRLAAAQSKVAEAWAWYRDKDKMAAQLKEEKAEEAAQKQFEKDFEDLKWRRDWRTAKDLSVDQEAVRRVALAKEEETAAQKALAETAKSTAQAAASLAEIEKVITQEG
ncbi:MAG: hypothetical protein J6V38_08100 [Kiritimatiellae bacterium]|nr:hypothetical protein [Kiritimatiellia bacterium]